MFSTSRIGGYIASICSIIILSIATINVSADDAVTGPLVKALDEGKVDLNVRLRYEHSDDDLRPEEGEALTVRTALGFTTGKFYDFTARLLVQDVREVGVDDYDDATGRSAVRTQYAVIADPAETDLLESYIGYHGFADTTIKVGRQIITYRKGPLHRFIGTVGWRQNWQNHDAVTLVNKSLKDFKLSYAYSWNVNRIFTDEAVVSSSANFEGDSHFFNLQYSGFKYGTLEAYAYLLDFDNALANSLATYGVRFSGAHKISKGFKLLYAGEYAMQDDYGDNPANVDEDYFQVELGGGIEPGNGIDALTVKISYEFFEGNGTTSFRTPLATAHAYQGWADRFLVTPANGIEDLYVTAIAKAFGVNILLAYHDLSSDNLSYDYGTEFDAQVTKALNKHFTVGLKYANYDADNNANNVAGAPAADVSKFWAWVQFKY